MAFTLEETTRLRELQQKVLAGTSTMKEEIEGIMLLRQNRIAAQMSSSTSRAKKAAASAPVDIGAKLAELKAIGQKLATGPVA